MDLSQLKWTPEAVVGALALCISTAGGLATTEFHAGAMNTRMTQVEQYQNQAQNKLDQHQAELATAAEHDARIEQKLDDMIGRLDQIERDVRRAHH